MDAPPALRDWSQVQCWDKGNSQQLWQTHDSRTCPHQVFPCLAIASPPPAWCALSNPVLRNLQVLVQEMARYNRLLGVIRNSLVSLGRALAGLQVSGTADTGCGMGMHARMSCHAPEPCRGRQ
jgi:hypothetical protein